MLIKDLRSPIYYVKGAILTLIRSQRSMLSACQCGEAVGRYCFCFSSVFFWGGGGLSGHRILPCDLWVRHGATLKLAKANESWTLRIVVNILQLFQNTWSVTERIRIWARPMYSQLSWAKTVSHSVWKRIINFYLSYPGGLHRSQCFLEEKLFYNPS